MAEQTWDEQVDALALELALDRGGQTTPVSDYDRDRAKALLRARAKVVEKLPDAKALADAIWSNLNTIDTARAEGDAIIGYCDLLAAVTKALDE